MTGADASYERRPATPRRVRNGIKLKAGAADGDAAPRTWVAARWMALLDQLVPAAQRAAGLDYARLGQTTALAIRPGLVTATVQGRAPRPYEVRLHMPVLSEQQWRLLIDAMAAEAFYAAKLLGNEIPEAVETLLSSHDLRLFPSASETSITCGCPAAGPCKHVAAVGYLLGQRFDDEPLAVFGLRGMESARFLDRLATSRASHAPGEAASHAEAVMQPPQPDLQPLDSCIDAFWRPGPGLAELQSLEPPHHAPHALLRRLGPSPLPGRFPLVGLLASIYDTVSEAAIEIRDRAEGIQEKQTPTTQRNLRPGRQNTETGDGPRTSGSTC